MFETLFDFLSKMVEVYNDEKTSLEEKIKLTCEKYIDMTIAEPLLPTFDNEVKACCTISRRGKKRNIY